MQYYVILCMILLYICIEQPSGEESPSYRPKWGVATPPSALRGHAEASPFEVSGEFLSTTHHTIEDITSGHQDMKHTLEGRLEVSGR